MRGRFAQFENLEDLSIFFLSILSTNFSYPTESPLEGEDAIQRNREIMGATNPEEAEKGTIRAEYALNIEANSVHGSDSEENATIEIAFFFDQGEINS